MAILKELIFAGNYPRDFWKFGEFFLLIIDTKFAFGVYKI